MPKVDRSIAAEQVWKPAGANSLSSMGNGGTREMAEGKGPETATTRGDHAPGETSGALYREALLRLQGGVNSPVRAYRAVGGTPRFLSRGQGAYVEDVDGHRYVDWSLSYGPLVLGHADPRILAAVSGALGRGTTFGAPTRLEVELARRIQARMPHMERLRMVSSGTEATMSALRVARAATGRDGLIKFAGGYHGHADPFLAEAGSGALAHSIPGSAGVPAAVAALTHVAEYNDLGSVEQILRAHPNEIAAIFVEPVAGNMGVVAPLPGFLEGLRRLCDETGALLAFDEVITGFRIAPGGARERFGVTPDLATLGKIVGGGLPAAAFGGRADLMGLLAPDGPVFQAGTLSGNPLAMAAGCATLDALSEPGVYDRLEATGRALEEGLGAAIARAGATASVARVGAMLTVFFCPSPPRDLSEVRHANTDQYGRFFHAMASLGVLLPPSQFECMFVSTVHRAQEVETTLWAAERALSGL